MVNQALIGLLHELVNNGLETPRLPGEKGAL